MLLFSPECTVGFPEAIQYSRKLSQTICTFYMSIEFIKVQTDRTTANLF